MEYNDRNSPPKQGQPFDNVSIDAFRSLPIQTYRQNLRDYFVEWKRRNCCCRRQLDESVRPEYRDNEDDDVLRIQSWNVLNKNYLDFPWKELCSHHDTHGVSIPTHAHLSHIDQSTTPLQEFVTMLLDPSIFPRAQVVIVIKILFQALLDSPRRVSPAGLHRKGRKTTTTTATTTRWAPSQLLFLRSIVTLWNTCPILNHFFSDRCTTFLLESAHDTNTPKWNRLLSSAYFLATECPIAYSTMIRFILDILCHLEKLMESIIVGTLEKNVERPPLAHVRRKKKPRLATLDELHDQDLSSATYYHRQYVQQPQDLMVGVSLKEVLSSRLVQQIVGSTHHHGTQKSPLLPLQQCNPSLLDKSPQYDSIESDEWALVLSRAYRKFYTLFRQPPSSILRGRTRGQREPCPFDLHTLLTMIGRQSYCSSACLRLCLIGVNHSLVQCRRVCRMVWDCFLRSKDKIWLRIYSELVVSWSWFNDRQTCWDVTKPLVAYVEGILDQGKDDKDHNKDEDEAEDNGFPADNKEEDETGDNGFPEEKKEEGNKLHRHWPVFQCLAYILSRRSRSFERQDDELCRQFRMFIHLLIIHCGELDIWLDRSSTGGQSSDDGNWTHEISTLQRLGILGWTSLSFHDDCDGTENLDRSNQEDEYDETEEAQSTSDVRRDDKGRDMSREDSTSMMHWPYSTGYDLRSAYDRLGTNNGRSIFPDWDTLLTDPNIDQEDDLETNSSTDDSHDDNILSRGSPPMNDYLHPDSDLLRQIFIFCDFQELLKCELVCRGWKWMLDTSNSIWRDAYKARFPIHSLDPCWKDSKWQNENWKGLLVAKILKEQSLCHQRHHGTGYKYRTCPFIGCHHVLKNQHLEESHTASHLIIKDPPKTRTQPRAKKGHPRSTTSTTSTPKTKRTRKSTKTGGSYSNNAKGTTSPTTATENERRRQSPLSKPEGDGEGEAVVSGDHRPARG